MHAYCYVYMVGIKISFFSNCISKTILKIRLQCLRHTSACSLYGCGELNFKPPSRQILVKSFYLSLVAVYWNTCHKQLEENSTETKRNKSVSTPWRRRFSTLNVFIIKIKTNDWLYILPLGCFQIVGLW